MPRFDATGPGGQGPGTGWGRGPCGAGLRRGGGRGRGMGQAAGAGFGGGFRRGYGSGGFGPFGPAPVATGTLPDDAAILRAEAASLKSDLEAVQKRIQELEGNQP
ncbi:MAG: DUF5320 family protein [Desulfobaccales bacterium]